MHEVGLGLIWRERRKGGREGADVSERCSERWRGKRVFSFLLLLAHTGWGASFLPSFLPTWIHAEVNAIFGGAAATPFSRRRGRKCIWIYPREEHCFQRGKKTRFVLVLSRSRGLT